MCISSNHSFTIVGSHLLAYNPISVVAVGWQFIGGRQDPKHPEILGEGNPRKVHEVAKRSENGDLETVQARERCELARPLQQVRIPMFLV